MKDRVVGALLGLACGDAVGTTLEFELRGTFTPIEDMVGGGPFKLKAGEWTDDTSMALCLGASLLHKQEFDPVDQMNRYCNWYHYGYMSSTGECFDIGGTVSKALDDYLETGNPFSGSTDEYASGNGALMRLAPVPMYYHADKEACLRFAVDSSRTTHASPECLDSAELFASLLFHSFRTINKHDIFSMSKYRARTPKVADMVNLKFLKQPYEALTGSGYVIESLEAALWCFMQTDDFEQAILTAANIGNDADTTAAICGQIAGAFYGASGIPEKWINKLTMRDDIQTMAERLYMEGESCG